MSNSSARNPKFYHFQGTIPVTGKRNENLIYINRPADEELYECCLNGDYSFILTSRQMGKSSLMARTQLRLREREEDIISCSVDITMIGTSTVRSADEFYVTFLKLLLDRLPADVRTYINKQVLKREDKDIERIKVDFQDWWQLHRSETATARFNRFLQEVVLEAIGERELIIFVDEVDALRSLSIGPDDFFAQVRALYNQRNSNETLQRLTFILIGCAKPKDLIQDDQRTPFNIGTRIHLTDFEMQDALDFVKGFDVPTTRQKPALERIFYWTNGHPYLTNKLCNELAKDRSSLATDEGIDQKVRTIFLVRNSSDFNINKVESHLKETGMREQLLRLLYRVYSGRRVHEEDERFTEHIEELKLAGIVSTTNGYLGIRNEIYRAYFNERWMDDHLDVIKTKGLEAQLKREDEEATADQEQSARDKPRSSQSPSTSDSTDAPKFGFGPNIDDKPTVERPSKSANHDWMVDEPAFEPGDTGPLDTSYEDYDYEEDEEAVLSWMADTEFDFDDAAPPAPSLFGGAPPARTEPKPENPFESSAFGAAKGEPHPTAKPEEDNPPPSDDMQDFLEIFQRTTGIRIDGVDTPKGFDSADTTSSGSPFDADTDGPFSSSGPFGKFAEPSPEPPPPSSRFGDAFKPPASTTSPKTTHFGSSANNDYDDHFNDDDFDFGDDDLFADDSSGAGFGDVDFSFEDDFDFAEDDLFSADFGDSGDLPAEFPEKSEARRSRPSVRRSSDNLPSWLKSVDAASLLVTDVLAAIWPFILGVTATVLTSVLFMRSVYPFTSNAALALMAAIVVGITLLMHRTKVMWLALLILPIAIWFGVRPPVSIGAEVVDGIIWRGLFITSSLIIIAFVLVLVSWLISLPFGGNPRVAILVGILLATIGTVSGFTVLREQTVIVLGWYAYPAIAQLPSFVALRTILLGIAATAVFGVSLYQTFTRDDDDPLPLFWYYSGAMLLAIAATTAGGVSVMTFAAIIATLGLMLFLADYIIKELAS